MLDQLPQRIHAMIIQRLHDVLFPTICAHYEIDDETALRMESASPFLVRYQANKSSGGMRKHKDNAHISYIINLSKRERFTGGGTHIYALNRTITSDQGQAVVFPSQVLHSGVGITRGERYILSGFASLTKEYILQKRLLSYSTSFTAF